MGESVVEEMPPKLGFKVVGTAEIASTGRSVKIDIAECTRNYVYDCKNTIYMSREHLVELLHGHRKTVTLYILVPAEELE